MGWEYGKRGAIEQCVCDVGMRPLKLPWCRMFFVAVEQTKGEDWSGAIEEYQCYLGHNMPKRCVRIGTLVSSMRFRLCEEGMG